MSKEVSLSLKMRITMMKKVRIGNLEIRNTRTWILALLIALLGVKPNYANPPVKGKADSSPKATASVKEVPVYQCEADVEAFKKMQENIYNMKDPKGDKNLAELLIEQDELKAREALVNGLLNVRAQYDNYLGESAKMGQKGQTKNALSTLRGIKNFIDTNSPAVSRYQLFNEAFSQFDPKKFKGKSKPEVFNYVKNSMQKSCNDTSKSTILSYCQSAKDKPNFWADMSPDIAAPSQSESTQDAIYKFIELTAVTAKKYTLERKWVHNLSSLFVDNAAIKGDILADKNLSTMVSGMIGDTIKECRKQVLISNNKKVDCLGDSKFMQNHRNMAEVAGKLNLWHPGSPKKFNSMQEIVDTYLENAQKVTTTHHENVGGTISKLAYMAKQREQIAKQMKDANSELQADLEAQRKHLKDQATLKVAAIGNDLKYIQDSKKVFARHMGKKSTDTRNSAQQANALLKELMGSNAPDNLFEVSNGKLSISDANYKKIFSNGAFTKDKLTALLTNISGKGGSKSIKQAREEVAVKIRRIRSKPKYTDAEAFKRFAWKSLIDTCAKEGRGDIQEVTGSSSCLTSNGPSQVGKLLKIGGEFVAHQSNLKQEKELWVLKRKCERLYKKSHKEYKDNGYNSLCNKIALAKVTKARKESAAKGRSNRLTKEGIEHKMYTSDGKKRIASYFSKSMWGVGLVAATRSLTTLFPSLAAGPLWQSYAFNGIRNGTNWVIQRARNLAAQQSYANQTVCPGNSTTIQGGNTFPCFLSTPGTVYGNVGTQFTPSTVYSS